MFNILFLGIIFGFVIFNGYCDRLLFVHAIWRNGERTPLETFPTDPAYTDWNGIWDNIAVGELTELGMRQQINLGKKLREIYVDRDQNNQFLNTSYISSEIYIRSSDVNRTLVSATCNLIGMFPGAINDAGHSYPSIPEWPNYKTGDGKTTVGFVPIAIHTLNKFYDYTLNPYRGCNRLDEILSLIEETAEYNNTLDKNKDFLDNKLPDIVGIHVDLSNISTIADVLISEEISNTTKAHEFDDETIEQVLKLSETVEKWKNGIQIQPYKNIDFSIEIPKLRVGNLLWSIIENMQMKKSCSHDSDPAYCQFFKQLKFYAYSAHGSTLAALSSALKFNHTNFNDDGIPEFSSAVTIELWQNTDGTDYLKLMQFKLDSDTHDALPPIELKIPGCVLPCSIDNLATLLTPYKPIPDQATLCNTKLGDTPITPTTTEKTKENSAAQISILSFIPLLFAFLLNN